MIDPHWSVIDLDPYTWRSLGRFFDPGQYIRSAQPGEHALFILHDQGRPLRVVDTEQGVLTHLNIQSIDDPQTLARSLYAQGTWQRVHVINKSHLANVARLAQTSPAASHLDTYYRHIYHLLWSNSDSYVSIPPHPGHWHGWTYQQLQQFAQQLPQQATLALGVFEQTRLDIGLILELHHGIIKIVTTFEALPDPTHVNGVTPAALQSLWQQLSQRFAPPAAALLCTRTTFDRWITTETNKLHVLQDAQTHGHALWQLLPHSRDT